MQSAIERHFTVLEVSELWQLHPDTVRKMFRDQPGVLKIGGKERRGKQGYVTLRIPESVLARIHAERTKAA
jgi:hypothetical protein